MHPPLFDFVNALSAEESCPVCEELHAAVDQRVCGACGIAMCQDCASLRPDTSWACKTCQERAPARVFELPVHTTSAEQAAFSALLVQAAAVGGPLKAFMSERVGPLLGATALAFVATLHALWSYVRERVVAFGRRLHGKLGRSLSALSTHRERVYASFLRDMGALADALGAVVQAPMPRVRLWIAQSVLSIRNVSVREQLTGWLLGVAILVSVARADQRNSR